MKLQNFVLNLSRNLETQLPAHVGKALGQSGQLPSFNKSDPGTRTPSKHHFQQATEGRTREERRGKEKRKEKEEKRKSRNCFGLHRFKHVEKEKSNLTAGFHSSRTVGKQKLTNPLGRISHSVRAVLLKFPFFNFSDPDLLRSTSKGIQHYTQSS